MTELLHAWALAPAAVGTCCLAARRRRVRVPELAASVLMLLAMMDAASPAPRIAPVWWAAVLLGGAMALAAVRGARRRPACAAARPGALPGALLMSVHTATGMVAMAALLLAMAAGSGTAGAHPHGVSSAALHVLLLAGAAAYAVVSAYAVTRAHGTLDRVQYVGMAVSTSVMALALIG
ncbi:hypothetical protein [Microbacterium sp. CJ88]|uniref:hypothetical protein n=1 Tax=Microbacterium sp. CJ88 TaxID=3445672 RepID=UPI003F65BDF6